MATGDLRPHDSFNGGTTRVLHFRLGALSTSNVASTSFRQGEVLLQNASAGDIDVIADASENVTTNHYIAGASSAGLIQYHGAGEAAATYDIMVPVYPLTGPDANTFITQNVFTGSATLLDSTAKDLILVGDTVGLWRAAAVGTAPNGTFGVDTAATGLKLLRKLDSLGRDCDGPAGGTCVFFVVGQNT